MCASKCVNVKPDGFGTQVCVPVAMHDMNINTPSFYFLHKVCVKGGASSSPGAALRCCFSCCAWLWCN